MIAALKRLIKRSPGLTQLYYVLELLPSIPPSDWSRWDKLRLIFQVKPYSGLSYQRLAAIYELAGRIEADHLPGNCVECGVWNGGSAALAADRIRNNPARQLWLFDSWAGLPEPQACDISMAGQPGEKGTSFGYQEKVEELLFKKLAFDPNAIRLVKGWFQDTLPACRNEIGHIAFLHLDCDWYASVKLCLEALYDPVVPGGVIVIDDYGYWQGCQKAVDEFWEKRSLHIPLISIDDIGVYVRKE